MLDWGVAWRAVAGEAECGDMHLVCPHPNGVLVAVVDGLGHGEHAATAASAAVGLLSRAAHEPLGVLLNRCHDGLRATRGVVMSVASFDATGATMAWMGIGNVSGVLAGAAGGGGNGARALITHGGVVGHNLPPVRPSVHSVERGHTLVLATDGIGEAYAEGLPPFDDDPQRVAERILAQHGKDDDDALVLVARCLVPT